VSVTSVAQDGAPIGPESAPATAVLGAGPNPSGGRFRVIFTSAAADRAAVDVFDATGRRVGHLEEACRPGRNELVFEIREDGGRRLSAGVYFMILSVGDREIASRKLSLLR
jgi:hypothetical protein